MIAPDGLLMSGKRARHTRLDHAAVALWSICVVEQMQSFSRGQGAVAPIQGSRAALRTLPTSPGHQIQTGAA